MILLHKILDNSLFSLFLTSFLSHLKTFQKKSYLKIQKTNKSKKERILRFFTRKIKQFFLVRLFFFHFHFFLCHQTSAILGSILHIILNFSNLMYYFGNMWFTYVAPQSSEKVMFIVGGSRTLSRHCIVQQFNLNYT